MIAISLIRVNYLMCAFHKIYCCDVYACCCNSGHYSECILCSSHILDYISILLNDYITIFSTVYCLANTKWMITRLRVDTTIQIQTLKFSAVRCVINIDSTLILLKVLCSISAPGAPCSRLFRCHLFINLLYSYTISTLGKQAL